jgi:hypothetical protein
MCVGVIEVLLHASFYRPQMSLSQTPFQNITILGHGDQRALSYLQLSRPTITFKCQFFRIPPRVTGIIPPSTPMFPLKHVMNDVRHEKRHRWKVMYPTLKSSVRSSEHQWANAILQKC